jgi:hypothetical protein
MLTCTCTSTVRVTRIVLYCTSTLYSVEFFVDWRWFLKSKLYHLRRPFVLGETKGLYLQFGAQAGYVARATEM